MSDTIRIGITHGDINGVSYEILMKVLSDSRIFEGNTFIVYGSAKAAAYYKKIVGFQQFVFHQINSASEAHPKRPNLINCVSDDLKVEAGVETQEAGKASYEALERAVTDLKNKEIDVIVTAPLNKQTVSLAGYNFTGHTEYFASAFDTKRYIMLLCNDFMRVGLVSTHIPLSQVPEYITQERILEKLEILQECLQTDFGIRKPRIAVLGLNPHAGDKGVIGNEEQNIIIPALETARNNGIMALGPYPADGFFGAHEYTKFDAVLGMYHDQILTPFKAIDFDSAVNYTAGLPIIRVSPGHGTAYGIVGQGIASESPFLHAIYTACDVFKNRNRNQDLLRNKLNA